MTRPVRIALDAMGGDHGGFARAAFGAFQRAATLLAEGGRFDGLKDLAPNADLNRFFHEDQARRGKP